MSRSTKKLNVRIIRNMQLYIRKQYYFIHQNVNKQMLKELEEQSIHQMWLRTIIQ